VPGRLDPGAESMPDSSPPSAIAPTRYARIGTIPAAMIIVIATVIVIRRRASKAVSKKWNVLDLSTKFRANQPAAVLVLVELIPIC
jgi:hypothetical protein